MKIYFQNIYVVVCTHSGLLLGRKKDAVIDEILKTLYSVKASRAQKDRYCVIPLL